MNQLITCPKCAGALHSCVLASDKEGTDTNTYMILTCGTCQRQLEFVVDLTPEFERATS